METSHNAMSDAADAALNDELENRTADAAQEMPFDRHQERIDEYKDQILDHQIAAVASIGGINADLLTFAKMMGSGMRKVLEAEDGELETFRELAPVFTAYHCIARQIERNEALTQRIQNHQVEMLEMKSRTSSTRNRFGIRASGAEAHRDTWQ